MSVTEELEPDIQLKMPSFSVDTTFPNVPHPLPQQSMFWAFIGAPRSGKSSLATALLTTTTPKRIYAGVYDNVFIIIPQGSFNSMTDNPFRSLAPDKVKHELTLEVLEEIEMRCETYAKQKKNTLIIIDDMMTELKNIDLRKSLERLIACRRHRRASIWLISQNYNAIPLSTRKMLSDVVMFRSVNMKELESLRQELVPIDKNLFMKVYNYIFPEGGDKHAFMYLKTETGEIFKRWSRLIIK